MAKEGGCDEFDRLCFCLSSQQSFFAFPLCAVGPALSAAMHLMMYLNEKGERVYTLKVIHSHARRQQLQAKARMRGVLPVVHIVPP